MPDVRKMQKNVNLDTRQCTEGSGGQTNADLRCFLLDLLVLLPSVVLPESFLYNAREAVELSFAHLLEKEQLNKKQTQGWTLAECCPAPNAVIYAMKEGALRHRAGGGRAWVAV